MSTLNKFIIYRCDICQRETEVLIDGRRPDPTRCNITHKCRGKLQRVGESSSKKFLFTPPVNGLKDYLPRGTVSTSVPSTVTSSPVSLMTGAGTGMLSLALLSKVQTSSTTHQFKVIDSNHDSFLTPVESNAIAIPSGVTAELTLFKLSSSQLQYNRFTYVISGVVQLIKGPDASPSMSTLHFTPFDKVRVFVNGVELDSTAFDRSVNDQITLTPAIYDTNNVVDVFVYQDLSNLVASDVITLSFKPLDPNVSADLAFLSVNCWGDVNAVAINDDVRYLLHCTDLSLLSQDSTYGVANLSVTFGDQSRTVLFSEASVILGKSPYSFRDKELYAYVPGINALDGTTTLSYSQDSQTGVYQLFIDESLVNQSIRPLTPFAPNGVTVTATTDSSSSKSVQHKYILGPT